MNKLGGENLIFLEKLVVSVISTLIFSLGLAAVNEIVRGGELLYFNFGMIVVYCIYSFPIFLIGGGGYSYFVDVYFDNNKFLSGHFKYFIEFLLYIAGGVLVIGVILIIIFIMEKGLGAIVITDILAIGILASSLYFHVTLVFRNGLKFYYKNA